MRKITTIVIAILSFSVGSIRAQTPDPLSFFPHHLGDIWEYYSPDDTSYHEQNIITRDTLGSDGRHYIQTTMFGQNIIDTTNFKVYRTYNGADTLLQYNLQADSGDSWVVFRVGPGVTRMAIVVGVYEAYLFGSWVTIKQIDYVDSASGLQTYTDYLASDFGLVGLDFDTFPYLRIRGTRINGVQHGTITSVDEGRPLQAQSFHLHQNYPNPFNPATILRYQLANHADVELTVYDIKGQRVRTLVREHQQRGDYEIHFDARGLASGVYVYILNTSLGMSARKMLLLR